MAMRNNHVLAGEGGPEIGHFSVTNNYCTAQEMGMDYRVGLKLPKTLEALHPFPERLEEWIPHDN